MNTGMELCMCVCAYVRAYMYGIMGVCASCVRVSTCVWVYVHSRCVKVCVADSLINWNI